MFEADWTWVGPLCGAAAVALRTYLKGSSIMKEDQRDQDILTLRQGLWDYRDEVLDRIMFHDCQLHQVVMAELRLAGLDVLQWTIGALADDRETAEA